MAAQTLFYISCLERLIEEIVEGFVEGIQANKWARPEKLIGQPAAPAK
jgi:hypothetical protein